MTSEPRRPYPAGHVPAEIADDTVIYRTAGMTFTLGYLRHAGSTDEEIAADLRVCDTPLQPEAARWLMAIAAPGAPSPPLDPPERYAHWLLTGRDLGPRWKEILRAAAE
jgi:hypothetical protein